MSSSSGMARTWASISLVGAEILVQIIGFDWLTSHLWGFASISRRSIEPQRAEANHRSNWLYEVRDRLRCGCKLMSAGLPKSTRLRRNLGS
jgi:hypothetical protein